MGVLIANPRVDNDKLISFASSKFSPSTYDFEILSLLAKSTKFSIPCHSLPVRYFCDTSKMKIECNFELTLFRLVAEMYL